MHKVDATRLKNCSSIVTNVPKTTDRCRRAHFGAGEHMSKQKCIMVRQYRSAQKSTEVHRRVDRSTGE